MSSRGEEFAMMRTAIALMTVMILPASAGAQGPTAPGTPLALLVKPRVQKELKLDDEQVATVKKLHDAVSENPKAAGSAVRALAKTLKPEQYRRLKQISYQVRGGAAVGDNDVAKALGLTPKQKEEVKAIWVDEEKTLQMYLKVTRFRNNSSQLRQKFINDHRKKAGEKMLGVLSEGQQKQFAEMKGEKFDVAGLDVD
jgi:hypothetical protein